LLSVLYAGYSLAYFLPRGFGSLLMTRSPIRERITSPDCLAIGLDTYFQNVNNSLPQVFRRVKLRKIAMLLRKIARLCDRFYFTNVQRVQETGQPVCTRGSAV